MSSYRIEKDGDVFYYEDANQINLHREDGPAIEYANGIWSWYKHGNLHREDGPASKWFNGDLSWYIDNERHREDGPAIEHSDGYRAWYKHGKRHREDGPAIEYAASNYYAWWVDGQQLTKQEFDNLT